MTLRRLGAAGLAALALAGCGGGDDRGDDGKVLVAALGDSITAGSPLWDPDPSVLARTGVAPDRRSQYEYWAARNDERLRFRNCGVFGERTDQIARRLDECAEGADALVVQGGINDIAQGRPVVSAVEDLRRMVQSGKERGLRVAIAEVLPWNNGYPAMDPNIDAMNKLIRRIGRDEKVPVYPWYSSLEDPANPGRMRADLTIDGDHPSVTGFQRLAGDVRGLAPGR